MIKIPPFIFEPIAERGLEYIAAPGKARQKAKVILGKPVFIPPEADAVDADGFWAAPYQIAIEGEAIYSSHAFGADAVQALQLVSKKIGMDLRYAFKGEFESDGSPEVGFPSPDDEA